VLLRRGRWQREDITAYDRICIAQRVFTPDRPWGEVTRLKEEFGLSRQSIYNIAGRVDSLFAPVVPGPIPCLSQVTAGCGQAGATSDMVPAAAVPTNPCRLVLTALFPGGVTLRPMQELLDEAHKQHLGLGTLFQFINQEGEKAFNILGQVNYSHLKQEMLLLGLDETFFDGYAILFVVDPHSVAICGTHVTVSGEHDARSWEPALLCWQEDQQLSFFAGLGDGARYFPKSIKSVLEEQKRFQEGVFHTVQELQKLGRKLGGVGHRLGHDVDEREKLCYESEPKRLGTRRNSEKISCI